jgi:soluble lytic murein transglycosylase-like protein
MTYRQHAEDPAVSNEQPVAVAAMRRCATHARRAARYVFAALAVSLACGAAYAADDCFNQAAAYQGVNPSVLRAVAWLESKGDASAVNRNANGSIDVGQLQINSIHFGDLARQGVPHRALTDPCINVYVAAWLLKQKMVKYGNTWRAIGAYHSESPKLRDAYARSIQKILLAWGELQIDATKVD